MNAEKEAIQVMRFLCGFPSARTTISVDAVNFYLKEYSDTVFVNGKLRRVVFTPITQTMYNAKTEEI